MNLVRIHPRQSNLLEPFSVMRNLMRWDPFRELDSSLQERAAFLPAFDVRETSEGYVFTADLPGVQPQDLDVDMTGNRLTLSGKREAPSRSEQETFFIQERSFGTFRRTFNLPEGVQGQDVKAELKDGVLTVTVPKAPEVQPRKVEIRTT